MKTWAQHCRPLTPTALVQQQRQRQPTTLEVQQLVKTERRKKKGGVVGAVAGAGAEGGWEVVAIEVAEVAEVARAAWQQRVAGRATAMLATTCFRCRMGPSRQRAEKAEPQGAAKPSNEHDACRCWQMWLLCKEGCD